MTKQEFLHGFDMRINYYKAVEIVDADTLLIAFDGWDSLTRTQVYYWLIDNGIRLTADQLREAWTVGDLMKYI
jgi:hypothetical protein